MTIQAFIASAQIILVTTARLTLYARALGTAVAHSPCDTTFAVKFTRITGRAMHFVARRTLHADGHAYR